MPNSIHSYHIPVQVVYCTRYLLKGECRLKSSSTLIRACSQAQDYLCLKGQTASPN